MSKAKKKKYTFTDYTSYNTKPFIQTKHKLIKQTLYGFNSNFQAVFFFKYTCEISFETIFGQIMSMAEE